MNFVAGKVVAADARGAKVSCDGGLSLAFDAVVEPLAEGARVTVGVRPEKLRIDDASAQVGFPANVRLTEYLGRETIVYADAGALATTGSDSGANVFTIQVSDIKPFAAGAAISVGFDNGSAYLFDAEGRTVTAPKSAAKS